jgi:hypothetical protein
MQQLQSCDTSSLMLDSWVVAGMLGSRVVAGVLGARKNV